MSDRFRPPGPRALAAWIADELDAQGSILGLPGSLWFRPASADRFALELHRRRLGTPVGVAAGPHTQLAQNIVLAWLCGARIIELKTVQTLDRISVSKPCIDMLDEGYNIEWSQELTVEESFREYLTGWLLIHALHHRLGFAGESPDILFDLSVGYDLEGLQQPNMRWFLERAACAGDELESCRDAVLPFFPEIGELSIPDRISDCVTVSTLHGCPPHEIGAIAEHLMGEWGLHTAVKLNPTLVGFDDVRDILVNGLGWRHVEPHRPAFDADIGFEDAVALLGRLSRSAEAADLDFGVKLCNTLPVINRRPAFDDDAATAYLSGRPLHALAVELAHRLRTACEGNLSISFAGGADAFNTPRLLAAGLRPVTACSDLLRIGGYLRIRQYLEEIDDAMDRTGAADLDDYVRRCARGSDSLTVAADANLRRYADGLRRDPEVACSTYRRERTKTERPLGFFDCIAAPCTDACGVDQAVPEYMRCVAAGAFDAAADVIARDNPLPTILGRACHHPCETVCTRTHLDEPVAIREIKRFVTDHGVRQPPGRVDAPAERRVAVVGAGPCGLATATELARAGVPVTVFEARKEGGGMVSATIPGYRASDDAVRRDLEAVNTLGVEFEYGVTIGRDRTIQDLLDGGFDCVVVAGGAQRGLRLGIDGEDAEGVIDGLDFLRHARRGLPEKLGHRIAVIGGGDVAMDCARSARRFADGDVSILYRRTVDQMPAHPEEIRDLLAEGVMIRELLSPRRVLTSNGRLKALECAVMTLGEPDRSGRPRPVEIDGETVTIELDTLIVAIGQRLDLALFGETTVAMTPSGWIEVDRETLATSVDRIYAGGDLREPGPTNIVEACGDGRRIARSILARGGRKPAKLEGEPAVDPDVADLLRRRSTRRPRVAIPRRQGRPDFAEAVQTLDPEAARAEASRCLDCDLLCSTCESVCPNRAIFTYRQRPEYIRLQDLEVAEDGRLRPVPGDAVFAAAQQLQVAVLSDFCNECGNCTTFCPTSGRPWRDKPRIMGSREDFEAEDDNAFMLMGVDDDEAILGRFGGEIHRLRTTATELHYSGPAFAARLDRETFQVLEIESTGKPPNPQELSFEPCAVLWTFLRGLTESVPFLIRAACTRT